MPHPLVARYDALWQQSAPAVASGAARLDLWATRKAEDERRGLTLLARPAPPVADALAVFLDALRALEPAQYYQPRADQHVTVLSLFTATADYRPHLARLDAYRAAVDEALAATPPFAVDFTGVTLAPDAVLAQGFPRDDTLALLRDRLRAALRARGLGVSLDERYRLETAHMTLVRFVTPLRDPARFVAALEKARSLPFGTTRVTTLALVVGDWYQSSERAQAVHDYQLRGAAGRGRRAPVSS